jgi:hypothetical protein
MPAARGFEILKRVDMTDPKVREKEMTHPGRKIGGTHGSWISDLVELKKSIVLCHACTRKFDHKKNNYYKQCEFPHVLGKCDACKNFGKGDLFLHWSEAKKCWAIKEQTSRLQKPIPWL